MTQEWFLPQHKNKSKLAFVNARIIDPESGFDDIGGIIVTDGIIQDFGSHVKADIIGDDFKIINDGNVLSLYSGEDLVHQTNKVKVGYKTIISKLEDMV
jgi:hypothetical protein